jgi:acetyl esterase/lipase
MAAAIAYVFRHAGRLGIGTAHYSLWGSSAGARMAAAIGSHGVARFGGGELPRPAAVVMAYTGHSEVASDEPPTFVVVGEQDAIAPPSVMARRVDRLRGRTPRPRRRFCTLFLGSPRAPVHLRGLRGARATTHGSAPVQAGRAVPRKLLTATQAGAWGCRSP